LGLLLFIWAGSASAQLTIDGNFSTSEWQGSYTYGDVIRGTQPGTHASGGDFYDVEYVGLRIDQDANDMTQGTVSFALQTGFSFEGGRLYGGYDHLETGDLAIDLDMDGDFDAAIRFHNAFQWVDNTVGYVLNSSDIQFISGVDQWAGTTYYSSVGNWRAQNGTVVDDFSSASFGYGVAPNPDWERRYVEGPDFREDVQIYNNHVIEGEFDLALLTNAGLNLGDDVTLKWTMECGNDYLSHTASTIAAGGGPGGDPVPEPATALLMGLGLAGFAAVRRRRFKPQS